MVAVGLLTLRVHINHAQSLKDKRQVLRALKDRLRRFNVAVSEVDFQETDGIRTEPDDSKDLPLAVEDLGKIVDLEGRLGAGLGSQDEIVGVGFR